MAFLAVVIGIAIVVGAVLDLVNAVITTQTSSSRFWLSHMLAERTFAATRRIAVSFPDGSAWRERIMSGFAPFLVLLTLTVWTVQQVLGFGLIWWGLGGVDGVSSLADALYYSGVVYFTVGFGEVVPAETIPRFGALTEAFSGVVTTALVIGYLPALYSAYSERERKLMTLDDGQEGRLTPTDLVIAWAPDGDVDRLNDQFAEWEEWAAGILETHTTFPMLGLFRSHHAGQNWVTALGVLTDAAMHAQFMVDARNRDAFWFLRRSTKIFQELTEGVDLSKYEDQALVDSDGNAVPEDTPMDLFYDLYERLEAHGFELVPIEEAWLEARRIRPQWAPAMEYLIDEWLLPRGFWVHEVGLPIIHEPSMPR